MNRENQGYGTDPTSNIFIKRKRGRPRKDQSQISGKAANVLAVRDQTPVHTDQLHITPGFERTNGNADHSDESMVGQTVTGVIEATFDAGFLLSVRIGNSDSSLRGIIFKPGHYMPVSTENDVAPHTHMINRNTVTIPTGSHTPVHSSYHKGRGRGRGRARNESRAAFSVNRSNENQLDAYNEPSEPKTGEMEKAPETDNGILTKPVTVNLADEVITSNEGKLPLKETQNESDKLSDETHNTPMQAMWSDPVNQTPSVHHNFRDGRAGKMTELLLAVQENLIDNQAAASQLPDFNQHQN